MSPLLSFYKGGSYGYTSPRQLKILAEVILPYWFSYYGSAPREVTAHHSHPRKRPIETRPQARHEI